MLKSKDILPRKGPQTILTGGLITSLLLTAIPCSAGGLKPSNLTASVTSNVPIVTASFPRGFELSTTLGHTGPDRTQLYSATIPLEKVCWMPYYTVQDKQAGVGGILHLPLRGSNLPGISVGVSRWPSSRSAAPVQTFVGLPVGECCAVMMSYSGSSGKAKRIRLSTSYQLGSSGRSTAASVCMRQTLLMSLTDTDRTAPAVEAAEAESVTEGIDEHWQLTCMLNGHRETLTAQPTEVNGVQSARFSPPFQSGAEVRLSGEVEGSGASGVYELYLPGTRVRMNDVIFRNLSQFTLSTDPEDRQSSVEFLGEITTEPEAPRMQLKLRSAKIYGGNFELHNINAEFYRNVTLGGERPWS